MFLFNKKFFYLHVVCELSRHGSQELVAVEHGARQLPLLHKHRGDPVSVRDARKILIIDVVRFRRNVIYLVYTELEKIREESK